MKPTAVNLTFFDVRNAEGNFLCARRSPLFAAKLSDGKVAIEPKGAPSAPPVTLSKSVFDANFDVISKEDGQWMVRRKQSPLVALKVDMHFIVESPDRALGEPGDYIVRAPDGSNTLVRQQDFDKSYELPRTSTRTLRHNSIGM